MVLQGPDETELGVMPKDDHLNKCNGDGKHVLRATIAEHLQKCSGDGRHVVTADTGDHLSPCKGDHTPQPSAPRAQPVAAAPKRKRKPANLGPSKRLAELQTSVGPADRPKSKAKRKK